jgi:hypothetical protein
MNTEISHKIVSHVSKIVSIASAFHAKFGRDYRLDNNSPAQAWELYRKFMSEQNTIASLLETEAIEKPYSRYGEWWERRDMIDCGLLNELAAEANTLVERVAYLEAMGRSTVDNATLIVVQQAIAGLLHPSTRQINLRHSA